MLHFFFTKEPNLEKIKIELLSKSCYLTSYDTKLN